MKKLFLGIIIGVLILAGTAFSQTVSSVKYTWTAPTEGSPAVEYTVEYRVDGGNWIAGGTAPTTEFTFLNVFEFFKTYEVRVAGVDIIGRQGPFSLVSDPYMPDQGPPGTPGQPIIVEVIE